MKTWIAVLLMSVMLSGCLLEPEPEQTTSKDAQSLVDSLTYVRAKNGLCFGVGTTSKLSTSGSVNMSNVMVVVDCDSVKLGMPHTGQ